MVLYLIFNTDIDKDTGFLIANGDIDPHSRQPFEDQVPVNIKAKGTLLVSLNHCY